MSNDMPKPLPNPDFTKLQQLIEESTKESVEEEYEDEDFPHFVYEAAMEAVYGKKYWDWRNKQEW